MKTYLLCKGDHKMNIKHAVFSLTLSLLIFSLTLAQSSRVQ